MLWVCVWGGALKTEGQGKRGGMRGNGGVLGKEENAGVLVQKMTYKGNKLCFPQCTLNHR